MTRERLSLPLLSFVCLLHACSTQLDESNRVGMTQQALDACSETVPANRNIDGFPAYAQCAASENSAIYSNNGVDTSLTSMGSDWVRTQYSGGYQCTELAHRYWQFKWQVKWIPNGDAGSWCDTQPPASSGVVQTMSPVHGDLMVLAAGSCGAGTPTGHVTVVDLFDSATSKLTVVEQNGARRGTYMLSCAKCFLHIVANNGTGGGAGAPPPSAAGKGGGSGASGLVPPPRAGSGAPRAGSAAPPVQMPVMPIDAGVVSAPPVPVATAGAPANSGVAGAVSPTPVDTTRAAYPVDPGCSVLQVGRTADGVPYATALSMALGALLRRRRKRA